VRPAHQKQPQSPPEPARSSLEKEIPKQFPNQAQDTLNTQNKTSKQSYQTQLGKHTN
jgi:hypothetical protein